MNAKTWGTICGLSFILFVACAANFIFAPKDPMLQGLGIVCQVLLLILGLTGAWFGILLAFDRFKLGCPFYGMSSPVTAGNKKCFYLECPSCGCVAVTFRPFRTAMITKVTFSDDGNIE